MGEWWLVGLAFLLLAGYLLRHDVEDAQFWFRWMRWRRWDVVAAALVALALFAYVGGFSRVEWIAEILGDLRLPW
jgi:hypothetical protein